jgi:hypothetical protein
MSTKDYYEGSSIDPITKRDGNGAGMIVPGMFPTTEEEEAVLNEYVEKMIEKQNIFLEKIGSMGPRELKTTPESMDGVKMQ